MKLLCLIAVLLAASALDPSGFREERGVRIPAGTEPRACAALDASVYAHAAPALADLRLLSAGREVPYALTVSETEPGSDPARVLNAGQDGGRLSFDLAMPARPYSDVALALDAHDFVASATVTGGSRPGAAGIHLGTYTLFDLLGQHLGGNRTLRLPESTFPFLHVELTPTDPAGKPRTLQAAALTGADVPASRRDQTLYTEVARATELTTRGQTTVASFDLPAHVPVERVTFIPRPGDTANFSREVTVSARTPDSDAAEELGGTIARVRLHTPAAALPAPEFARNELSVPATLGANMRAAAHVEVAIHNGDDRPLDLLAVTLEMRARNLCFDVPPAGPVTLFYGSADLVSPQYDLARTFTPGETVRRAALEPERPNPDFREPGDLRTFADRHPGLVWFALLAVAAVLGLVALRTARKSAP